MAAQEKLSSVLDHKKPGVPVVAAESREGMPVEPDDARATVAALFQKHSSGGRSVDDELIAAVRRELCVLARERRIKAGLEGGSSSMYALYVACASALNLPASDHMAFVALCARTLRRVVVDHMRAAGERDPVAGAALVMEIDAALEHVERINPRLVRVAECCYFAGLSEDEAARVMDADVATLRREWLRARGWTLRELSPDSSAMDPANAAWIDAVLDDALALPPEKVHTILERCSAAPGGLRASVEALLAFASATRPRFEPGDLAPEFLSSILAGRPAQTDAEGSRAGSWRIIREIHRGRLGVLHLAETPGDSGPIAAALRFLPPAVAPTEASLRARFEWRVLASLRHPDIASVLDAGETADGQVFIVSELVEGRSVDRYCRDEGLTIQQRLELFVRVCFAVHYAHRQLAVHGGIRPSIILVTATGETRLLDYGIAGLFATIERPGDGGVASSIAPYASPEQRRQEPLTVASDVYQLGLLLKLLVTDRRRPGATADGEEGASVSGDLHAIVSRALQPEPERRYHSVGLLRSDVQRYLRCRPVSAQDGTLAYRVRKFIVRRRLPLAVAAAAVIAAAAILPRAIAERVRVSRESARVSEVEQLLAQLFATFQPAAEPTNGLIYLKKADRLAHAELAANAASQSRLFTEIGRAYAGIGEYQRSVDILEEGLALREKQFGDDSVEVAETLVALGRSRHALARWDQAETNLRTAIAIRELRRGAAHPETLDATIELGEVLRSRGRLVDAEEILRRAVAVARPEIVATSSAPANESLPKGLLTLANVLRDRGAVVESATIYREVIALLRQTWPQPDPRIAAAQVDFSQALIAHGELAAAEAELTVALPVLRRTYPHAHPVIAAALRRQASLRMEQGRLDEATAILREAERIEQEAGAVQPTLSHTRALLAEVARRSERTPEAIAGVTTALADLDRLGLSDHPWSIEARTTLGAALIASDRYDEARAALAPAAAAAGRLFVSYDARRARLEASLAVATSGRSHNPPNGNRVTGSIP
jgi:eukaryotic-like serine/threonine-protein kinase